MTTAEHLSIPVPAAPPDISVAALQAEVARQFALEGEYSELVSERDRNFRLVTAGGRRFVVKATSTAEDAEVTDFQIQALLHLERQGLDGVPRIIRTVAGEDHGAVESEAGEQVCVRVVSWLEGKLLSEVQQTPAVAARFGRKLAELNKALEGFSHPGERQELLWDSQRAELLRELLEHVNDQSVRDSVVDVLDAFDQRVKPVLPDLPQQVIHNDANDDNVLLDEQLEVTGIIDFGDMMLAPRVIDLSTAASYLRSEDDPLQLIRPFVAAYRATNPLQDNELDVLYDLIRTRLSMTLVILYWRLAERAEDDPYRQKSLAVNQNALSFLQSLSEMGQTAFREQIDAASA